MISLSYQNRNITCNICTLIPPKLKLTNNIYIIATNNTYIMDTIPELHVYFHDHHVRPLCVMYCDKSVSHETHEEATRANRPRPLNMRHQSTNNQIICNKKLIFICLYSITGRFALYHMGIWLLLYYYHILLISVFTLWNRLYMSLKQVLSHWS